ncbi:class I SAM-dependent methyltransferase [Rubinisphaera margarita]|uniref:class I SAM-dependent methyltransferase n=1 Tax=Rubinisphaera margarita TaxID=2909586 RepID=UPI001EE8FEA2|nr:class I SAM-dependent methyltransferase [Rubinisphaera margarita]MCG6156237.1 class I SAM-dependent methyltransferase [Rubinisphaera margarita]
MKRCHWLSLFVVLLSGLISSPVFAAEPEADESGLYEMKQEHDPNGIGKFYMGREIARVMGHQGALWLERPEREEEENLSLLVKLLDLKPGMVVADIGAGSGVLTLRMAPQVAPGGKVVAVDIQREMLLRLQNRMGEAEITNVDLHLGAPKSPELKPESVDLILMVDVYHEFEFPHAMVENMAAALKPNGRIALVEYRLEDPKVPIKLVHKMTEEQAIKEMTRPEFGLEHTRTIDDLPRQHLLIFTRKKTTDDE